MSKVLKIGVIKLIAIPLGLLTSIILARGLGPELFGQYALIMAIIPILSLPVAGGLPQLLVRSVARYSYDQSREKLKGILIFSYTWAIVFSLVIISSIYLVGSFFVEDPERLSLLKLGVWLVPLLALVAITSGVLKGLNKPVIVDVFQQLIQPLLVLILIAIFYLFYSPLEPEDAFIAQISSVFLCALIIVITLSKLYPKQLYSKRVYYQRKSWFKALIPFSMIVLANTFNTQIGIVILGIYSSDEAVAGLRIAERCVQFVGMSLGIINSVAAPYIVRLHQENDIVGLQKLAKNIARGSFAIALPIAIIFIIFGKYMIEIVFGIEYVDISYIPLVILSVGQLFNMFCGAVGNLLSMTGNATMTLKGQVVAVIFSVGSCFILVPIYGAIGAASGVTLGLITWNLILFFAVKKMLKINASAI